jgi:glycine cleavage system H protein
MEAFGNIEAVKAVSDLFCPVKAEVLAVNSSLDDDPAAVNSDPYGEGWMIKIQVLDAGELTGLLDSSAYSSLLEG